MIIGIDASRAFLKQRTGIEEYSYQIIWHLRNALPRGTEVILYTRQGQECDFDLPVRWKIKTLGMSRFWTQVWLSLEMLFSSPDVLFIPAHTVPLIHPKRTVVTIHGLEYEFCPEGYGFFERLYMSLSIRYSCTVARRVIAVSENTKQDLIKFYGVPETKILVIHEGWNKPLLVDSQREGHDARLKPYILFIGRLEERKNIRRMIEAFERVKTKNGLPHQFILVGKSGYGYGKIQEKIQISPWKKDIIQLGYVSEEKKWKLLKEAEVFFFPTLYEGFGLPILEAQSMHVPIITSRNSSLPEVAGDGAFLVDPLDVDGMAQALSRALTDPIMRTDIIEKGNVNVGRFSWEEAAQQVGKSLMQEV